jgi:hypothetical protein
VVGRNCFGRNAEERTPHMAQDQADQRLGTKAPQRATQANLFDITGPIVINYSRSSIAGVPLFSYRDADLSLTFSGDEIVRADSPVGELVTITLQIAVDAFARTFTLVVPEIRLSPGEELEFDAFGIETTDRSGAFVVPPGPAGVLQTSRFHQLHGTAQLVDF